MHFRNANRNQFFIPSPSPNLSHSLLALSSPSLPPLCPEPVNLPSSFSQSNTPGMSQQVPSGFPSSSMTSPQNAAVPVRSRDFPKMWEGTLSGRRQGQPVFICRLQGYRHVSASETLAVDWPPTMQIARLISQYHMKNEHAVGKAVFRALDWHGFLGQMQEKKLCAVIQLPSQTLLLSVFDKANRLIGMLFPKLILPEIGVDVASQLSSAPTGGIAVTKSDDVGSSDVDDLEKMLAALEFLS